MHAIILAGGFGTRLRSVVSDVPKPLASIADKPFLAWLIAYLARNGVDKITLSVHHDWQKIEHYFSENPPAVPVSYAVEEKPLGTGGAIAYAMRQSGATAPVVVLNGDSFIRIDYQALYAQHQKNHAPLTIVLREIANTGRYGTVIEKGGVITSFAPGKAGSRGLINAGVYIINPSVFSQEKLPEAFSFEQDFLPTRISGLKPRCFLSTDYFIDIGIPDDYERACRELPGIIQAKA